MIYHDEPLDFEALRESLSLYRRFNSLYSFTYPAFGPTGRQIAREGAEARIARFEVEMEAASRDLKLEKQRLQGARERIVLR